jgi:hypothetical protein
MAIKVNGTTIINDSHVITANQFVGVIDAEINGLTVGRGAGGLSTNTAVGYNALLGNTTGDYNTASGYRALYNNTTGSSNTASGNDALLGNTTGSNNTALGKDADAVSATADNQIAIRAGDTKWYSSAGSPEGVVTAGVGSMYTNTTGSAGTTLYVKESGTGNTGWVAQVDGYNRTEADAEFVQITGDTMTGDLNVSGTIKSTVSTTGDNNFSALSAGGGHFNISPDDATTANPTWVHKSNSSEDQAWVIGGVERMRIDANGTLTANQFVGGGAIILVGNQADSTNYSTTSNGYQTASRVQVTPSSSTSHLMGWFYCQVRATSGQADGDLGSTARVHYLNSSSTWSSTGSLTQNLRTESGTSTGTQEIAVTFPVLLTQSNLNPSGVWDVAIRHYEVYDATSEIDDGRFFYMEYEP